MWLAARIAYPIAITLAVLADPSASGQTTTPKPEDAVAVTEVHPDSPAVRVALPEGFADEASYIQSVAGRADELAQAAQRSGDAAIKAELLLAAANHILARGLEAACTQRLLRIDPEHQPTSADLEALLDRADALLKESEAVLRELASPGTEEPDSPRDDAQNVAQETSLLLDAVRAFSRALRAHLCPLTSDDGDNDANSARAAASALSPLLENRRLDISAAARFWQAVLRAEESDPAPALSILGSATSDPKEEQMPYAFFSGLLRCRLLADREGWPLALTLLMQIEERCNDWFSDQHDRDGALQACALTRYQVLTSWRKHLSTDNSAEEREWCDRQIDRLREDRLADQEAAAIRLAPAVPVIISPPDVSADLTDHAVEPGKHD